MNRLTQIRRAIETTLRERSPTRSSPGLPLVDDSIEVDEMMAVVETMLGGHITMGRQTSELEREWSEWVGVRRSLFVNSGSSANLLAVAALGHGTKALEKGDEIIVPAVAWSTCVFPIIQAGFVPVFVDVDPDTLNINAEICNAALSTRTRGILVVHLLGNPCPMHEIMQLAREHELFVIEDCCEAHGASVGDQRVGSLGDISTFSFYFSHHMTTGEGGMVCARDGERWADDLTSLRAHGWTRNRSDHEALCAANPDIDPRWLFVMPGYNVRNTDIAAAIGRTQLRRLDGFIQRRREIAIQMQNELGDLDGKIRFQSSLPGHEPSPFGFALLLDRGLSMTRQEVQGHLEGCGVETRPIVGGNLARQPGIRNIVHRVAGLLDGADFVHERGLMVGIHPSLSEADIGLLATSLRSVLKTR